MAQGLGAARRKSLLALAVICMLSRAAFADDPYASVTTNDGTMYTFYRTDGPVAASKAAATCAASGGTLAALESSDQVRSTFWSKAVVDAAGALEPALLWTGFKITWVDSRHRRMLRGAAEDFALNESDAKVAGLLKQLEDNPTLVPSVSADGRAIPLLIRIHLLENLNRQRAASSAAGSSSAGSAHRRALLSADGGAAATSAFLQNAVVSWADGSDVDMVLANTANLGFMACPRTGKKKVSECCGAVFDIGPDAYPGADFPSMFLYPCNTTAISGAMPPSGYACVVSPVAELPDGTAGTSPNPTPKPVPAPTTDKACKPGFQPVTTAGKTHCKKCKVNTYSADGLKCKKCPVGTKAKKGAAKCT